MEKEKFREIVDKIGYERDKWHMFHEIESIVLNSGRGLYPDWKHLRFLITSSNKLLVRHGRSEPYGARLNNVTMLSGDFRSITFSAGSEGVSLEPSPFYPQGFRQPRTDDIIRVTEGISRSYGESHIKEVRMTINGVIIDLWEPLQFPRTGRVSFYDPRVLVGDKDNCIHSTMHEGIYMHFVGNESKRRFSGLTFHEEIKIKDIREINLSIGSSYYGKTYKLN